MPVDSDSRAGLDNELMRSDASVPRGSIVVSASLLLAALLGAGQALLIAFIVGEGHRTDAFFAAYALYVAFAIFGATLRSSLIPLIGATDSDSQFRERSEEMLSRVLLLGLAIVFGLAVISPVVGQLISLGLPGYARWTTVVALLILSPAAFLQILGAAQAAVLNAAKRFYLSPAIYVAAGIVALAASAVLLELVGVLGAAVGLLAGAATLCFGHAIYLKRFGIHLRPRRVWIADARQRQVALFLLSASALALGQQLALAISLGAVSGEEGAITAYSYAFFAVTMALTVSSFPLSLVTMADLVQDTAARGGEAARDYLVRVSPYAMSVLAPLLVAFVVDGKPLLGLVFAGSLSGDTIDSLYEVGVVLCLMGIPASFVYLCSSVLLAMRRSRVFIGVAAITLAVQLVLAIPLSRISIVAVAAGQDIAITTMAAALLVSAFGRQWAGVAGAALWKAAPAFGFSLLLLAARAPFGSDPSGGAALASVVIGLGAYAIAIAAFWPAVSGAFVNLVRRRPRA